MQPEEADIGCQIVMPLFETIAATDTDDKNANEADINLELSLLAHCKKIILFMCMEPSFNLADVTDARRRADRLFAELKPSLENVIPCGEIVHVGSTAVAGCLTKGDLDIVVRVPAVCFAEAEILLQAKYRRNQGSVRTEAFSAFEDPSSSPHLGIQLVTIDGPFDFFHKFVDALRNSPELLSQYNELKRSFVGYEMRAYRCAKSAFIEQVLAE